MSPTATAFWVDRDSDREQASDGISRYGAYLRDGAFEPWTDHDQAVEWAVFAWRRATSPVMSPGYVRYHPRVLAARLERSGWDGTLVAGVDLVSTWPEQLKAALVSAVKLGGRDAYWQDWPTEYRGGETISYYQPSEADVAARPYALAMVSLQFSMPSGALPEPPGTSAALLSAGQQAVAVVVAELNGIVGPLLSAGLRRHVPSGGEGLVMAAELALAADPDVIKRSADPAGFVVQACQRAKAWLRAALEHGEIEQIAEIKSRAEAVRVYTTQKQLGKDAQLAATEIVRRAERGIGLAIRRGQQTGEIAKRGDRGSRGAPGVHGGNPGARRGEHLESPGSFFQHADERADAYAMTDGVSDIDFDNALGEARAEGNLSRANVVRKIRQSRSTAPPGPGGQATGQPPGELIARHAAAGMSSEQIAGLLGITSHQAREAAREHGIDIPADAVAGRTRRPDANRIVRETAHALEGLVMSVALADPADLDPAQAAECAASLARSIRVLSQFLAQMRKAIR